MSKTSAPRAVKITGNEPNFVQAWRVYRMMSQEALADLTGFDRTTISRIEKGKVGYSRESLGAVARALGVKIGHLFDHPPPVNAKGFVDPTIPVTDVGLLEPEDEKVVLFRRHLPDDKKPHFDAFLESFSDFRPRKAD